MTTTRENLAKDLSLLVAVFQAIRPVPGKQRETDRPFSEMTLSLRCARDSTFLARVRDCNSFTLSKYDEVIAWFDNHWPANVQWPDGVPRPTLADKRRRAAR